MLLRDLLDDCGLVDSLVAHQLGVAFDVVDLLRGVDDARVGALELGLALDGALGLGGPLGFALGGLLALRLALGELAGDAGLLRAAALHPVGEAFHCAGVHPHLSKIVAADIDLGLLAGAADGDVGVLFVGLPAADQDPALLRCDALAFVQMNRVAECQV